MTFEREMLEECELTVHVSVELITMRMSLNCKKIIDESRGFSINAIMQH